MHGSKRANHAGVTRMQKDTLSACEMFLSAGVGRGRLVSLAAIRTRRAGTYGLRSVLSAPAAINCCLQRHPFRGMRR